MFLGQDHRPRKFDARNLLKSSRSNGLSFNLDVFLSHLSTLIDIIDYIDIAILSVRSVVYRAVLPSTASPGGGWGSGL